MCPLPAGDSSGQDSEPLWKHLPDDPIAFFELAPGFDKKDLKRAYNRWIRRFKPEQFPAEFQRIRAGYERLEEGLRFGSMGSTQGFFAPPDFSSLDGFPDETASGDVQGRPTSETSQTPADAPGTEREPSREEREAQAALELQRTVRTSTIPELCGTLRSRQPKSPQEWVMLALAAEEAQSESSSETSFYEILIEGLESNEGGAVLFSLLFNALREPLSAKASQKLLLRLLPEGGEPSPFIDPNSYYALTSPLWEGFLEKGNFESFSRTLKRSRNALRGAQDQGYIALLVRLVRLGAYKADDAWMGEALSTLSDTYYSLPPSLQEELDQFDFLEDYRQARTSFLDGDELRSKIDVVLQKITTGPEHEADREFLDLQTYLLDHPQELLEAFPPGPEDYSFVTDPLHGYGEEVNLRRSGDELPLEASVVWRRLSELMFRLEKRTDRTLLGRGWVLSALLYLLGRILLIGFLPLAVFLPALLSITDNKWIVFTGLGIGLIYFLGATIYCFRNYKGSIDSKRVRFFSQRLYTKLWRSEIVDFLQSTHIPYAVLQNGLGDMNDKAITNAPSLQLEMSEDAGIQLLSLALDFAE